MRWAKGVSIGVNYSRLFSRENFYAADVNQVDVGISWWANRVIALALTARGLNQPRVGPDVVGVPTPEKGTIDLSLAKLPGAGGEKVIAGLPDGKTAQTRYRTVDQTGSRAAWLVFEPLTGRTHQLRVHAAALGTPILGDGKYGRRKAFLDNEEIAGRLHLHARGLRFPHPAGHMMEIVAPMPDHIQRTFKVLGFDAREEKDPFGELSMGGDS